MKRNKDWTGSQRSIFATLGASNHTAEERQAEDFYSTDPEAVKMLLEMETFNNNIWECACGEGHLSKQMEKMGYNVYSTDLIDRGYGVGGVDFLAQAEQFDGDIITNPPYNKAYEFIEKSLELIPEGNRVAMFLKVQFLEGKKRKELFAKYPPKIVYVSSSRILCAKNGDFENIRKSGGSAVAYCWFIWEKGFKGDPIIKWFN